MGAIGTGSAVVPALPWSSGLWYATSILTATNNTITNDRLRVTPILVPNACTIAALALNVRTAGSSGATVRLGIWQDDGTGQPGKLIVDAGTVDASTTGIKQIAVNVPLSAGFYWVGGSQQGSPATQPVVSTIGSPTPNSLYVPAATAATADSSNLRALFQDGISGPFSDWTYGRSFTGSICPMVLLNVL